MYVFEIISFAIDILHKSKVSFNNVRLFLRNISLLRGRVLIDYKSFTLQVWQCLGGITITFVFLLSFLDYCLASYTYNWKGVAIYMTSPTLFGESILHHILHTLSPKSDHLVYLSFNLISILFPIIFP